MTFAFSQECENTFLELYLLCQEASGTTQQKIQMGQKS